MTSPEQKADKEWELYVEQRIAGMIDGQSEGIIVACGGDMIPKVSKETPSPSHNPADPH